MKQILGWILAWSFTLLIALGVGFHMGQEVETINVRLDKEGGRVIVKVLPLLEADKKVVIAGAGDQHRVVK